MNFQDWLGQDRILRQFPTWSVVIRFEYTAERLWFGVMVAPQSLAPPSSQIFRPAPNRHVPTQVRQTSPFAAFKNCPRGKN